MTPYLLFRKRLIVVTEFCKPAAQFVREIAVNANLHRKRLQKTTFLSYFHFLFWESACEGIHPTPLVRIPYRRSLNTRCAAPQIASTPPPLTAQTAGAIGLIFELVVHHRHRIGVTVAIFEFHPRS